MPGEGAGVKLGLVHLSAGLTHCDLSVVRSVLCCAEYSREVRGVNTKSVMIDGCKDDIQFDVILEKNQMAITRVHNIALERMYERNRSHSRSGKTSQDSSSSDASSDDEILDRNSLEDLIAASSVDEIENTSTEDRIIADSVVAALSSRTSLHVMRGGFDEDRSDDEEGVVGDGVGGNIHHDKSTCSSSAVGAARMPTEADRLRWEEEDDHNERVARQCQAHHYDAEELVEEDGASEVEQGYVLQDFRNAETIIEVEENKKGPCVASPASKPDYNEPTNQQGGQVVGAGGRQLTPSASTQLRIPIQKEAAGKAPPPPPPLPPVTPIQQDRSFYDDGEADPAILAYAAHPHYPTYDGNEVQLQHILECDIECSKHLKASSKDDSEDGMMESPSTHVYDQGEKKDKKQRGRPKKEKETPPVVTPNGNVSDYEKSSLRRSQRARFEPIQWWKNERLMYGPHNEEGYLGEAMGDMPVVTHVNRALPTKCEVKEAKPQQKAPVEKTIGGKRGGKKRSGEEAMLRVEDMPKLDDKAFRKKYKKTFRDGELGSVWSEISEETTEAQVVSRLSNRKFSKLPLSKSRKKGESKKVGRASQAFHVQTDDDDLFPGYIAGNVVLPPRAIKDAEGVGLCSQVFNVGDCQPNSLEFALADPSFQDGEFEEKTAQRFLLSKGDMFQIPPGNVYRIENHSKTEDAKLFWTIIKSSSRAEREDSDSGEE